MGSTGAARSMAVSAGNSPGADVYKYVADKLKEFVESTDIRERSVSGLDELDTILARLPSGAKIYTGSITMIAPSITDSSGRRLIGDTPTFYEKMGEGRYAQYRLFGSSSYSDTGSSSILQELARGKRLGKLDIRVTR